MSLTALRPSTSTNASTSPAPVRCARSSSRDTSSRPSLRVRAPVNSSVVASFRLSADLGAVPTRLGAFTGCLFPVALGAQKNVLPTRVRVVLQIVQTSQRITTLRATITKLGGPITIRPRSQPRRGTLSADHRHGVTVPTRALPRQSAPVVGDRVATGREIIVGSVLILIRASLIALTRSLVVIRPGLILITRRLVAITRRLVAITRPLVTHLINRTGQELGAAGAPRTPCRFAAGWTLHNLRHDPPIPERPLGEIRMVAA